MVSIDSIKCGSAFGCFLKYLVESLFRVDLLKFLCGKVIELVCVKTLCKQKPSECKHKTVKSNVESHGDSPIERFLGLGKGLLVIPVNSVDRRMNH
jgi:hypothetical protein